MNLRTIINGRRNGSQNELEFEIVLLNMSPACADLVDFVQMGFFNRAIFLAGSNQQNLTCNNKSNGKVVCKGTYAVNQLNFCETNRVDIRPIYSDNFFSEKVMSLSANLTSIRNQLPKHIQVDQQDSQTLLIQWNNDCLVAQIDQWRIAIDSTEQTRIVNFMFPHNCATGLNNKEDLGHHRIILSNGQITCNQTSYGKRVDLSQCSQYTIRITPFTNALMTEFSQQTNFTTDSNSTYI